MPLQQNHKTNSKKTKKSTQQRSSTSAKSKQHPQQMLQRAIQAPQTVSHDELIQLQSAYGSRVMRRVMSTPGGVVQAKRPLVPSHSVDQPMIQRDMSGVLANVKNLGGTVSLAGKLNNSVYNKILNQIDGYQKSQSKKNPQGRKELGQIYNLAKGWMDKSSHVTKMESENDTAVGRGQAMGYLMGKIARETGMFGEPVRSSQRPTIKLYMGQGIVANLGKYFLTSDEFSSCSPVVMYNSNTGIGGLYHFPAGALQAINEDSDESHAAYMLAMAQAIQPTEVHVHSGGDRIAMEDAEAKLRIDPMDSTASMYKMTAGPRGLGWWRDERDELMALFTNAFPNATVHAGSAHGEVITSMDNDGGLFQGTSGGSVNYDLASTDPPSDVIRFGHASAGVDWMSGPGKKLF